MKKLLLSGMLCAVMTPLLQASLTLSYFKIWDPSTGLSSNTRTFQPGQVPKYFCIVIPDAQTPIYMNGTINVQFAGQDVKFLLNNKNKAPIQIPDSFFRDRFPEQATPATVLVLDWVDSVQKADTEKIISEAGGEIIRLMQQMNRYTEYVLVGLGRGGIIASGIVNQPEALPKNVTLVLLGTPFAKDTAKYPAHASLNNQAPLDNTYIFYNNIPYRGPSMLPASIARPAQAPQDTYFLRFIANNKEQPVHKTTFLKLQDVLYACAAARTQYRLHHDLWVSFSNIKPETNGLTGILKNASPDAPASMISNEKELSNTQLLIYQNTWGSIGILGKSDTTPTRSKYKLSEMPKASKKLASKSA